MLSASLCEKLPSRPPVLSFKNSAPNIVGVGGASAEFKGYIDVPLQLSGVEVTHPLFVVSNLPYPVLVGTDILRLHQATVSFGDGCSL